MRSAPVMALPVGGRSTASTALPAARVCSVLLVGIAHPCLALSSIHGKHCATRCAGVLGLAWGASKVKAHRCDQRASTALLAAQVCSVLLGEHQLILSPVAWGDRRNMLSRRVPRPFKSYAPSRTRGKPRLRIHSRSRIAKNAILAPVNHATGTKNVPVPLNRALRVCLCVFDRFF